MKKHPFSKTQYLQICLQNEKDTLQHLISAAESSNQPLDNSIIERQRKKILDLVNKITNLEKQNDR